VLPQNHVLILSSDTSNLVPFTAVPCHNHTTAIYGISRWGEPS
jgi:hypothetical protein